MSNYNSNSGSVRGGNGLMAKVGIFVLLGAGLLWLFNTFTGQDLSLEDAIENVTKPSQNHPNNSKDQNSANEPANVSKVADSVLPTTNLGTLVKHNFYALSYVEKHEQAEWVAYELTKENLKRNAKRQDDFRPDPRVPKGSASKRDYRGSGYDRGHMVPAGDMTFSEKAMSETFYLSNMSPQIRNFNGGIWRELEESVRYWTKKFGRLYVVSGPVLTGEIRDKIGGNEVSVPDQYYKVLLDLDEPEIKAIGFLLPNEVSVDPLKAYAIPIDEIEELTGLDFFSNIIKDPELEAKLESGYNIRQWSFSKRAFDQRVQKWNKR